MLNGMIEVCFTAGVSKPFSKSVLLDHFEIPEGYYLTKI